ncbi:MAG: recombinase family protein, partial [Bacillota bacterium]|nr:recombinase family protein [Bacillota bacterium]
SFRDRRGGLWSVANHFSYYQKVEKKLVIADDNTPDIVQKIFDWYQEGVTGMQAISNRLNKEGIPTPAQTHCY